MAVGLESLIGFRLSSRRPPAPIRLPRPPVRLPVLGPHAAILALESAAMLGAFVALTAFLSRAVVRRLQNPVPRNTVEIASGIDNGYEQALVAFESFHLSAT